MPCTRTGWSRIAFPTPRSWRTWKCWAAAGWPKSGALFVDPAHERRGIGRRLLETAVPWCWNRGLTRLWLTTEAGSRARSFYEAAGWQVTALVVGGQVRMELVRGAG
jgi:GNAT superfamily N-acetyltransferase